MCSRCIPLIILLLFEGNYVVPEFMNSEHLLFFLNYCSVTRNYFENLVRALENGLADVDSQGASSKPTSSKSAAGSSKTKGGKGKTSSKTGGSVRTLDDSGSWYCDQCTYLNIRTATACQMCQTRR